jgi:Mcm10 replication factor
MAPVASRSAASSSLPDISQILAHRSAYEDAAEEERTQTLLSRCDERIKLEAFEGKLREVTTREVTVFDCAQCEKTFPKPPEVCKEASHTIASRKETQYAFACSCGHRVFHKAATCAAKCPKCDKQGGWERTSVQRLKGDQPSGKAPLEGLVPKLLPRGEEQVNSLRHG